jgi:hypothetical protein
MDSRDGSRDTRLPTFGDVLMNDPGYTRAMVRKAATLLLLLWLPVQGFAAVAMPFCTHAMTSPGAPNTAEPFATPAHHATDHAAHHAQTDRHAPVTVHEGLSCNDCGACHLACAPAVPASAQLALVVTSETHADRDPSAPRVFVPEQPQPPPLA